LAQEWRALELRVVSRSTCKCLEEEVGIMARKRICTRQLEKFWATCQVGD